MPIIQIRSFIGEAETCSIPKATECVDGSNLTWFRSWGNLRAWIFLAEFLNKT